MKIAFVAAHDPSASIRLFSGIPYHMYWALARRVETIPLGVTVDGPPKWWDMYSRLLGRLTGRRSRWGMRPSVMRSLAARTAEKAASFEVDAVLTVGQGYLVYWNSPIPAASFSDILYGSVMKGAFPEEVEIPRELNWEQERLMKIYAQQAVDNAAHVFVTSKFILDGARRFGTTISPEKVTVTHMGANFKEMPALGDPPKPPPPLKLMWLGTNWEGKGGPEALVVLDRLVEQGLTAELHLIGRMPDNLEHPHVVCHGFLRKEVAEELEQLLAIYRQSHLLILPTRKDTTPCGLAEAAALGVPAVTTPVGGIPGMFNDGEVVLIPFNMYEDEAPRVILELVRNGRIPDMAQKVRRRFETALNWDVIAEKIVTVLESAIDSLPD